MKKLFNMFFNSSEFIEDEEDFMNMKNDCIQSELRLFARAYFNKHLGELTEENDHIIDSIGIFGVSDWLNDHPYETKEAEKFLQVIAIKSKNHQENTK